MRRLIPTVFILLIPVLALAGPPVVGTYQTTDLGGQVLPGHFSESWLAPTFYEGNLGNTINAQSWDGGSLGTQWTLICPSIMAAPTMTSDTRVAGTGTVKYETHYQNGAFWFGAAGPWGDEDYTVQVDQMTVTSSHLYVGGVLQSVVSDIDVFGSFDGYINCMTYTISNAAITGNTQLFPIPAAYPAFIDDTCAAGPQAGAWGDVVQATVVIYPSCEVGSQESTWGALKSRF
jgi:hypothetical protein